jgi:hypothetical protein
MYKKGRWIKTIIWAGEKEEVLCKDHVFNYNTKMPDSDTRYCIYCEKPEDDLDKQTKKDYI